MNGSGIDLTCEGTVFNIQKFSLNDGPGIRSIVFFKGCPLSCDWCSNPESQKSYPEVLFNKKNCVGCGRCVDACPLYAIDMTKPERINRKDCTNCGQCTVACYNNALVMSGKSTTVQDVVKELKKDDIHYRRSGGGVTLSGGEPLLQPEFAKELLKACKAIGWHTAMETTGYAPDEVLRDIVPELDLVLLDIKTIVTEKHMDQVGISNESLFKKFIMISELAKEVIVRVPVIPGFNDDKKSIELIAEFATYMKGVKELHLLPYHKLGENKYEALSRNYPMDVHLQAPSADDMEVYRQIVESKSIRCNIGAH